MPEINPDLHGNVPDTSDVALLLIDLISDFRFPCGETLLEHTRPVTHNVAALKRRAKQASIPCVYVNDNWGKWQSDFNKLVEHCLEDGMPGKPLVELLKPDEDDYFVLKPKHSGFFSTTLDLLLQYLGAHTLILTGVAGNICVLFTASDAYMRDYRLVIRPTASHRTPLRIMHMPSSRWRMSSRPPRHRQPILTSKPLRRSQPALITRGSTNH